jgi:hypothetical protein
MKFSPDGCITCGIRYRTTFHSSYGDSKGHFITDNQGTLAILPFWFCSDRCIKKAIDFFLEKRFHGSATALTDPNLPDDHIEEFTLQWVEECKAATLDAMCDLYAAPPVRRRHY